MFRFTRKPSSGTQNQYLAKNTGMVQCRYRRCQCYGGIIRPVWRVCCALRKRNKVFDEIWFLRLCHHISNAVYLRPNS